MRRASIVLVGLVLVVAVGASAAHAGGTIEGKVVYKSARWVKDTLVYVQSVAGDWKPENAVIDQKGSTFTPKFLPVMVGSTVTFKNSDPTDHNVYSPDHEKYDLGTKPQGGELTHQFTKSGVYTQLCKLHPTMIAYVMVLQNPFFGLTGKDGSFTIENVPPGSYKLLTWNERFKADVVEVVVTEGGTAEVEIKLHR